MKCEDCKFGKVKTTVKNGGELMMDRYCFFHVPQVQLIPDGRGNIGQISFRPQVQDDDFCNEFKEKPSKDKVDEVFGKAGSPTSSIVVDSN